MKGFVKVISPLLAGLLIVGCAEFNQQAAETVQIKTANVDHCTYMGRVSSTDGSDAQMASTNSAIRERHLNILKTKARDLGANTIVLTSHGSWFKKQKSALEHIMTADAYRCPNSKRH